MAIRAYMQTCRARNSVRITTLAELKSTDWADTPLVVWDDPTHDTAQERQNALVHRILQLAVSDSAEMMLLLEDDLNFNRHIQHNLSVWYPLRSLSRDQHFFASLYHPSGIRLLEHSQFQNYATVDVSSVSGSQALLVSLKTVRYMLTCWGVEPGPHIDLKLARLAARVCPLTYHIPSLVQHVGYESVWGGPYSSSTDFDRDWMSGDNGQR